MANEPRRYFVEEAPTGLFHILFGTETDAEVIDLEPFATREEAEAECATFRKEMAELEAEEHSEAIGLARMEYGVDNDYDQGSVYDHDESYEAWENASHYEGDF